MKASTGGFLHLLLWHLRVGGREIGKGGKGKTFQGGPMASLRATEDVAALSSRSPLTIGPFSRLKRPLLYIAPPWQRGRRLAALDGGDEPRGIEVPMICVRNQPRSQFGADNDVEAAINFWETGKLGKSGERADREGERVFFAAIRQTLGFGEKGDDGSLLPHRTVATAAAAANDFVYYAHLIYDPCWNPRRKAQDEHAEGRGEDREKGNRVHTQIA